jgi:hypothetical protein
MNPVIINSPLNSYDVGQRDAAISVINTNLTAPEFDAVFRDAINDYLEGWLSFEPEVQRTLSIAQSVENTDSHTVALTVFNNAFMKQEAFGDANKVFEHEGQKLLLTHFIENEKLPADFSVMSLTEWLEMKTEETTTGFQPE